jgi:hypothetical protein
MNNDTTLTGGRPRAQGLTPTLHAHPGYAFGYQAAEPLKRAGKKNLSACAVNQCRDRNNIARRRWPLGHGGAGGVPFIAVGAGGMNGMPAEPDPVRRV